MAACSEFFRNEHLNARNFFQKANPTKPEYRRNQYGGLLGGPVAKDRTFFFADYQGQRQQIGRTVTSTVPTVLQRQGIFTEAIAGRVPVIYDPATTVGIESIAVSRQHDSEERDGSRRARAARALSAADRRRDGEQLQPDRQRNQRSGSGQRAPRSQVRAGRDQVFGRLTHFRDTAVPVTAFPDGSGTIPAGSVAIGPQETRAWAFASNYQHTFSSNLLNEVRIGDTRRSVERTATQLPGPAGAA